MRKISCRAFTLVELLIVVTILGILVAMVIPRLTGRTEEARRARAASDIQAISLALDAFEMDTGDFPNEINYLYQNPGSTVTNWHGPYLKKQSLTDPWGQTYVYAKGSSTHNKDYDLSSGGDPNKPNDDITNY